MNNTNYNKSIREVAKDYEKHLKSLVPTESGSLKNSIKAIVKEDGLIAEALSYIDFVDKGVNGTENNRGSIYSYTSKRPPIDALRSISDNPYAMATSIYKKGIKPQLFLEKAEESIDLDRIIEGYGEDIEDTLNKTLNK